MRNKGKHRNYCKFLGAKTVREFQQWELELDNEEFS